MNNTRNTYSQSKKTEASNAPIIKLRIGLITASIWQRITEEDAFYTVTFDRRYRDSKGNWQSTQSYSPEDLLILAKLADQAHTKIYDLRGNEG